MPWTKVRLSDRSVEAIQCAPGRHDVGPAMPAYVPGDAEAVFAALDNPTPSTPAELDDHRLHYTIVRPLAQYDERPNLNGLAETVRRLEEKVARMENRMKRIEKEVAAR